MAAQRSAVEVIGGVGLGFFVTLFFFHACAYFYT